MQPEEIIKGNEIIAKFMISKKGKELKVPGYIYRQDINDGLLVEDSLDEEDYESFKYHSSWDWLMPVVQKIEDLGYWVEIRDVFCTISNNRVGIKYLKDDISTHKKSKIEATWFTVVEFIKWYNKNK